MPPHVFAIAESAYYAMNAYSENQCVIISVRPFRAARAPPGRHDPASGLTMLPPDLQGESGAGKTEAAKRIMQYIAEVSGSDPATGTAGGNIGEIKDMVLATNPLLESFGCAKTLRNDNSSRHVRRPLPSSCERAFHEALPADPPRLRPQGKYLEIMFNKAGQPVGAQITNYLLEKGRVVQQIKNERNFHIFYQFTKGASAEQRGAFLSAPGLLTPPIVADTGATPPEMYGIQGPESYVYTSRSGCLDVPSIDDLDDFAETLKAMDVVGLTAAEKEEIFRVIAGILWLGNVRFKEDQEGNAMIPDEGVTEFISYLMEVEKTALNKVLVTRVMETTRGGRRGARRDLPPLPDRPSS
jgi:myosin-1